MFLVIRRSSFLDLGWHQQAPHCEPVFSPRQQKVGQCGCFEFRPSLSLICSYSRTKEKNKETNKTKMLTRVPAHPNCSHPLHLNYFPPAATKPGNNIVINMYQQQCEGTGTWTLSSRSECNSSGSSSRNKVSRNESTDVSERTAKVRGHSSEVVSF